MKVLVTGGGALLGQGIIRSLRMAFGRYEIIAVDPDPRAVGLYWADHAYLVPFANAPDYLSRIEELLAREHPAAVLIGTDVELAVFAIHRERLEKEYHTHIIVSAPEVVRIADDKWLTNRFLVKNKFPHPRSALPESVKDLLQVCDFPLVVKPRVGARSVGVAVVNSYAELEYALAHISKPIIQEYIATPNEEFTSGLLVFDGVRAVVTMRRDLKDGNTVRAYFEPDTALDQTLARIAEALGAYGPINLQFRLDKGVPKIFEINARFSGTTPLRAYAGFNEVDALLGYLINNQEICVETRRAVTILRYWNEIIVEPEQIEALSKKEGLHGPAFQSGYSA